MKTLKVFIYCLLCHLATSEVTTTINEKEVAPSLTTITSKDSELVAETKSRPTKRDSADQTATYDGKQQKEEPFKPMYRAPYQQEQQFRPTTVRYALAGAAPQNYYEKQDLTGGIQYAAPTKPTNNDGGILYATPSAAQRTAAVNDNIINGIPYGASAYREAFFNPNYHQQHPQQSSHYAYASPSPQQVKASSTATEAAASPISQQQQEYYSHSDPEEQHYMYERMQQLQQQQQQRPHQPQQQQIRYIIAIPIEYARQLQQQFAHVPTHASQAFALQHQNVAYRPQIHYTPAATNTPPTEASIAHTVPTAYTMQVIKLPAGLLQSLEASIYQKPAVTVAAQQYQQPAPYYQHPQQQQQQTTIYYAYPYHQQHQPQHQHQQQQQQLQPATQQQAIVRIGSTKPSATVAPTSPTLTSAAPVLATPSATPHFIQSKQILLQQQHQQQQQLHQLQHHLQQQQQQQQQKEPMSFTHYTQSHAPAPPYFIRQVFLAQPAHAAPHHAPAFVPLQPPLPGGLNTKLSYVYPYAAQMHQHHHQLHQHEAAAAALPYFRHPGAVHYGTHLYHPPTSLTPPNKALGPVVATRQQQQPQQHQYQHPTAAGVSAAESGPTPSSVVKYP